MDEKEDTINSLAEIAENTGYVYCIKKQIKRGTFVVFAAVIS